MMIRGSIGVFQFCDAHLIFIMEGVCPLHWLIGGNETIVRFAWTQTWSRLHITIVVMMVFLNTIMIMAMMVIWTIEMIMRRKMFLPLHGFYFRCLLQPECFCQNLFLTFLSWNMWERIWFGQFFLFSKIPVRSLKMKMMKNVAVFFWLLKYRVHFYICVTGFCSNLIVEPDEEEDGDGCPGR